MIFLRNDVDFLKQKVEERQGELLDLVKTLITYKTPAPPARNTQEAQEYVGAHLKKLGYTVDMWDVYPNDPNVVGVLKGTNTDNYKSLIINGHMDVAEVSPDEKWIGDPFIPVVENGHLIGRGAADMKGGLGSALFALQLLKEYEIELPGDITLQSVIGEEVGEAGTLQCCKRGKGAEADFAIVVDTSDLHIQGQGGVITGWITIKSNQTYHDATRRNMIHAGGKLVAASAIEKMSKVIQGLQELERHWAITKSYPGCPPGTNTINPAVIEGGRHAAFIADECRLWITVHYYPDETYEKVTKEIEEHILNVSKGDLWLKDNPPSFTWGGTSMIEDRGEIFPSLEVDPEHAGVQLLSQSHYRTFHAEAKIDVSPTVTDGGWLAAEGIPTVIYGPGDLTNAHAVNEKVSIDQLVDFTKILLEFIYTWSHTEKEEEKLNDL